VSKNTSLREFGYNFLGPICSEYFQSLLTQCAQLPQPFIGFLAREGYLLNRIFQTLVAENLIPNYPSAYVLSSRSFLFRICVADPSTWQWSLTHKFSGSLEQLLVSRFGLSLAQIHEVFEDDDLSMHWYLPEEQEALEAHFYRKRQQLNKIVKQTKRNYIDYLRSIGLTEDKSVIFADVGYSGTIQKLITKLLKVDTSAVYFITSKQGDYNIDENTAHMHAVFKDGVKMGDGYTMLDRSLFLEALLTSPQGQFLDIAKTSSLNTRKFNFSFGKKAYSQHHLHELQAIFEGAIEACCHFFRHNIRFSIAEIEMLNERYVTQRHMLPRSTWALFDVDDAISGNGNVDPLRLFRL